MNFSILAELQVNRDGIILTHLNLYTLLIYIEFNADMEIIGIFYAFI